MKYTTVSVITPEEAAYYREHFPYPGQRKLRPARVKEYGEAMTRGEFQPSPVIFCYVGEGERGYLVDGQHRLAGCEQSRMSFPAFLIHHRVENFAQMAKLYAGIDSHSRRSIQERMRPLLDKEDNPRHVSTVGAAVIYAEMGFPSHAILQSRWEYSSPYLRERAYNRYMIEWDLIRSCLIDTSNPIRLTFERIPVLSVFLEIAKTQSERTGQLIRQIARNDKLEKYSPAWQFVNNIVPRRFSVMEWQNESRIVASIWNAYYRDEKQLTKLFVRDLKKGILISGTSFKG
jgi:hypothetical protein